MINKNKKEVNYMKTVIGTILILGSICSLSASMAVAKFNVNIREKPSTNSKIVGSLKKNNYIDVYEKVDTEEGSWYKTPKGYIEYTLLKVEAEEYELEALETFEDSKQKSSEEVLLNEVTIAPLVEDITSRYDHNITLSNQNIQKIVNSLNKSQNKNFELIPVTLQNLVAECIKRNSSSLLQKIQADVIEHKIKYEEGILDPILTISVSKSFSHIPNDAIDSSIQRSAEYKDDILSYTAGVGGMLSAGTKWDVSYLEQSKNSTYIEQRYPMENSAKVELNIRQPLLKGFGTDNTLVKIDLAKIDSKIARSEYSKNAMDLVGSVIQLYWQLYGTYKLYVSWENSLNLAEEQLKNIKDGLKYGKQSNFELFSAEKSVSLRKIELQSAKSTIFEIQNKILTLLSLSSSYNDDILFMPIDKLDIESIAIPNLEESYEKSIENWPELAILRDKVAVAKLKVAYSKNQISPQLDFVLNVNRRTLRINDYDMRKDLKDKDFTSWVSTLEFSIPIFNDYADENFEMERLKQIQSNIELNQMSRTLNNGIDSKIKSLQNHKLNYYEYLHGIAFQTQLVEMEYQRLKLGKSSIVEVFEQQENLINYERKLYNNIIDLKLSEAALQKASGILLERYNIELFDNNKKYEIAKDVKYENK